MAKPKKPLTVLVLALYLLLLSWGIVFKFGSPVFELTHAWRSPINLVPFGAPLENPRHAVQEMLFNFAAFMPMGLLLSALSGRCRAGLSALMGLGVSLLYEALQYLLAVGSADVTDVILNTLGALAGAGAYLLLRLLLKEKTDRAVSLAGLVIGLLGLAFLVFLIAFNV